MGEHAKSELILRYFDGVARGVEAKLQATPLDQPRARKLLTLELARLGRRIFGGEGRLAWCGVLAPFDLLNAMGITSCFVEFVGAMLASSGMVEQFLTEAEQAGYSTDTCAYHRAVTGVTLQRMMPEPELLIATSAPCVGGMAVVENLARHYRKPLFVIDVPQRNDPRAVAHLARQLEAMTEFVAAETGESLDPARLRQTVERTNQMRQLLIEVYRESAAIPTPARRRDLVNFGIVVALLFGTDDGVRIVRAYRDEFAASNAAQPAAAAREQARLMWIQNRVQFRSPIEALLEEELGATIVVDELNTICWEAIDPDDPFPGMARRLLSIPLTGPIENRVGNLVNQAREFAIDGAINPCHWGCRQGTGARGLIEESLARAGVAVLNLEVDCVDPRSFAVGQLRTRLEAFIEMLAERRRPTPLGAPGRN